MLFFEESEKYLEPHGESQYFFQIFLLSYFSIM